MKTTLWLIFIGLLLFSCGQKAWTKRGYKHGWIKSEIKFDTIITKEVSKDTLLYVKEIRDTLLIKEDRLTIKHFFNIKDSTIYISGKCDKDTIRVEKIINTIETKESFNWTWIMIAFCLGLLIALVIISKLRN